ncbi:MAG: hypothetical protein ACRD0N_12385, partial [Acidimicrobiales bacterium]
MRRGARLLMYLGTAGIVLGLGKVHAANIGHYDFTGSARFAWSLAYIALLGASAYGVGLPELPRTSLQAALSAAGAAFGAAMGISLLQLATGDALLPRFVVLASAVGLVPFYMVCSALAARDRRRSAGRDRVVAVVGEAEAATLRNDIEFNPERPASLVQTFSLAQARGAGGADQPLARAVGDQGATVVVLDRQAQNDEAVVAQAAMLHE